MIKKHLYKQLAAGTAAVLAVGATADRGATDIQVSVVELYKSVPAQVVVTAHIDPEFQLHSDRVQLTIRAGTQIIKQVAMRDDGSSADERPGDNLFTATLELRPTQIGNLEFEVRTVYSIPQLSPRYNRVNVPVRRSKLVPIVIKKPDFANPGQWLPYTGPLELKVNGKAVLSRPSDGSESLWLPYGSTNLTARASLGLAGTAEPEIQEGPGQPVTINLDDSSAPGAVVDWDIEGAGGHIIPANLEDISIRPLIDGSPVRVRTINYAFLESTISSTWVNATSFLSVDSRGRIRIADAAACRQALSSFSGTFRLMMAGEDESGRGLYGEQDYRYGIHTLAGTATLGPNGRPANGVRVTARILNSPSFATAIVRNGRFDLGQLPPGLAEIRSEAIVQGQYLSSYEIRQIGGPQTLSLSLSDGAAQKVQSADPSINSLNEPIDPNRLAQDQAWVSAQNAPMAGILTDEEFVTVNVSAGARDALISDTKSLLVPKGTKTLKLTYRAWSAEYPYWVTQQSIYNDVWAVRVIGPNGDLLDPVSRQVNSQLYSAPIWQAGGFTNEITVSLNVKELVKNSAKTVRLYASAMNIGDSLLPTGVDAMLEIKDSPITITSSTTTDSGSSIPMPGENNYYPSYHMLSVEKQDAVQLTTVKIELLDLAGNVLQLVSDGPIAQWMETAKKAKVDVAFKTSPSQISLPPANGHLVYRFTLRGMKNGQEVESEPYESSSQLGLYRMPPHARYNKRDLGLDDWCSKGAYGWLEQNGGLLTAIDDISGEHGRNIGHSGHRYGKDIDGFHFYTFPGVNVNSPGSGTANLAALQADVNTVAQLPANNPNAQAARSRVVAWINASRAGIDALASNANVTVVIYTSWGSTLLRTGRIVKGQQTLDFGTGTWSNAKYIPDGSHDNHVHIHLNVTD